MTEFQIPIIDISAFTTPEKFGDDLKERKRATALEIGSACKEVGNSKEAMNVSASIHSSALT